MIEPVKTLWAASSFSLDSASGRFLLSGEQQCPSGMGRRRFWGPVRTELEKFFLVKLLLALKKKKSNFKVYLSEKMSSRNYRSKTSNYVRHLGQRIHRPWSYRRRPGQGLLRS